MSIILNRTNEYLLSKQIFIEKALYMTLFYFLQETQSMTKITINEVEYDLDTLSNEAKAQLASIQFCDQELQRLQAQAAAYQTARMAYAKALNEALATEVMQGDKITFN